MIETGDEEPKRKRESYRLLILQAALLRRHAEQALNEEDRAEFLSIAARIEQLAKRYQ